MVLIKHIAFWSGLSTARFSCHVRSSAVPRAICTSHSLLDMIGIIRLKGQEPEPDQHSFADLNVGEGVESSHGDGLRIKIAYNFYLHFQRQGDVVANELNYWPRQEFK
ncbi:hypothetical protein LCGC14_3026820, partial [marine sediment metagenome]